MKPYLAGEVAEDEVLDIGGDPLSVYGSHDPGLLLPTVIFLAQVEDSHPATARGNH